jgi:hypothetical protein
MGDTRQETGHPSFAEGEARKRAKDGTRQMMYSGLMWYDPDPKRAASAKIEQAAERYLEKFGTAPNACHVSPGEPVTHDRLRVVPNRWIRPGYFWLGYDEELPPAPHG